MDSVIRPGHGHLHPPPRSDQLHLNNVRPQRLPGWSLNPESRTLPPLPHDGVATPTAKMTVDDTVASTDLQNPADALEFLAHVAECDSGNNQLPPMHSSVYERSPNRPNVGMNDGPRTANQPVPTNVIDYPPLSRGLLTLDMIQVLLYR